RDLLEAIGSIPILLPPTVLGFYMLRFLADSRFGRSLSQFLGHPLVFNQTGCVIVAAIAAFPFVLRSTRAGVEAVDPRLEQAARMMGLPGWRVALQVTLPLARRSLGVGLTLAFVRAFGEYGATLMVGGAIPGSTQTLPIAIVGGT